MIKAVASTILTFLKHKIKNRPDNSDNSFRHQELKGKREKSLIAIDEYN